MIAPALLRDPTAIVLLVVCFLCLLLLATGLWIRANRLIEAERLRSDREEPVDLAGAIRDHEDLLERGQEIVVGERRRVA